MPSCHGVASRSLHDALPILVGAVLGRLWGEAPVPAGPLAGLSVLAVVAAMNDTNGGLYMALMGQFGQPRDAAAYSVMSLESGPRSEEHTSELQSLRPLVCRRATGSPVVPYTTLFRSWWARCWAGSGARLRCRRDHWPASRSWPWSRR